MSDAQFFRSAVDDGRLLVRRCLACRRAAYPPMPGCPHCGAEAGEVVESTGAGTLYSWTVCHVAFDPAFQDDVPYVVGLIDLPEGARVVARVDAELDELQADRPLRAVFPTDSGGTRQLRFVPDERTESEPT